MVKDLFAYLEQLMVANFCKDLLHISMSI
jgi:hypothetical protein